MTSLGKMFGSVFTGANDFTRSSTPSIISERSATDNTPNTQENASGKHLSIVTVTLALSVHLNEVTCEVLACMYVK